MSDIRHSSDFPSVAIHWGFTSSTATWGLVTRSRVGCNMHQNLPVSTTSGTVYSRFRDCSVDDLSDDIHKKERFRKPALLCIMQVFPVTVFPAFLGKSKIIVTPSAKNGPNFTAESQLPVGLVSMFVVLQWFMDSWNIYSSLFRTGRLDISLLVLRKSDS